MHLEPSDIAEIVLARVSFPKVVFEADIYWYVENKVPKAIQQATNIHSIVEAIETKLRTQGYQIYLGRIG